MTKPFHFKQFSILQDKAAMKVGTDGVLLGAWANLQSARSVLDIGTGTGLLALMAAQRNLKAIITGIDISPAAVEQAKENVNHSIWSKRIEIVHSSLQNYVHSHQSFDHIICNPPFFKATAGFAEQKRQVARQQYELTVAELAKCMAQLLNNNGLCSIICPAMASEEIQQAFLQQNLFFQRICEVKPTNNKPPKRLLIECSKTVQKQPVTTQLVIEPEQRHQYSDEYIELTKEFYLNM